MKPSNISPLLLEKYLQNTCNEEEKEQVENWYASLRGKSEHMDTLDPDELNELKNETFSNISSEIGDVDNHPVRKWPFRWLTGIAASVILVLGYYFSYNDSAHRDIAALKQPVATDTAEMIQFVNEEPRIVRYKLPDGSSVWMHSEASITYPKEFDLKKRLVTFTGEGFFDIQKDKSRPFSIQSGEMVIKVLGTSFNVKARTTKKVFQISVVTGTVEVSAPDQQQKAQLVILKPRQQAFFETASRRLTAAPIPVNSRKEIFEPVTILFKETPLDQVINQLQKRFDIRIQLTGPQTATCRISADFEQESLPSIMEMLCTTLDATYSMSGKVIHLKGLPCD